MDLSLKFSFVQTYFHFFICSNEFPSFHSFKPISKGSFVQTYFQVFICSNLFPSFICSNLLQSFHLFKPVSQFSFVQTYFPVFICSNLFPSFHLLECNAIRLNTPNWRLLVLCLFVGLEHVLYNSWFASQFNFLSFFFFRTHYSDLFFRSFILWTHSFFYSFNPFFQVSMCSNTTRLDCTHPRRSLARYLFECLERVHAFHG